MSRLKNTLNGSSVRRRLIVAVCVFGAAVSTGILVRYLSDPMGASGASSLQSFTVIQVEQMMGSGKDQAFVVFESSFARRGDGSWAHSFPADPNDKKLDPVLEFVDVARRRSVHTEPITRSVMTRPLSITSLASEIAAGFQSCDGTEKNPTAAHQTMLGFDAVQLISNDPDGKEVRWVAPALDCYALQTVDTATDGRRHTITARAVQLGEPSGERFLSPSTYAERPPAKIQELYAASHRGESFFSDRLLPNLQHRYESAQRYAQ